MRAVLGVFVFALLGLSATTEPVTTASLLREMVDLGRFAAFPEPAYRTVQFSSHDRRSNLPGGPDWFANADGFGGEPIPNFEAVLREPSFLNGDGEYILCDVRGPGAIVRTWTARIEGNLRVYLDGAEEPLYAGPAEPFLRRPYDTLAGEAQISSLAGTLYQRNAAYCPMPFSSGCRIVWEGTPREVHFYEVQMRLYDKDVAVETFTPDTLAGAADALRWATDRLGPPHAVADAGADDRMLAYTTNAGPGENAEVTTVEGPGLVREFQLAVEAADRDLALRQTVLHIAFDDYPRAQVQAPAGDLFGAAPGVNPYESLPFSVAEDGTMTCRFVMPFEKRMRVSLQNLGTQAVRVRSRLRIAPYTWDDARSQHFRARWRIDHGVTGGGGGIQDMPYLMAFGKGVYVGTALYILNPNDVPHPGGNWWGEGDEKIFVDNDVLPSTFGTGSEDYFNYAWSSNDIFLFPYCAQPRNDGPANRGFVTNNRWHILDAVPFQDRIAFYMELMPHERTEGMAYGRIAYHYARPGMLDDHVAITEEDVREQRLPEIWTPAARGGASNSLFFEAEHAIADRDGTEMVASPVWSLGKHLRWTPRTDGETRDFRFAVEASANYDVRVAFAMDGNAGTVGIALDGETLDFRGIGPVLNLHRPGRVLSRTWGPPLLRLTAGEHVLTLRYDAEKSNPENPHIGVDFLWVKKL